MIHYNGNVLGRITIKEDGHDYEIEIRQGNCLAVFIYVYQRDGKWYHQLWNFFNDVAHLRRIIKNTPDIFGEEVVSVELNTRYKESATLLKYITKAGHKVTCYYE